MELRGSNVLLTGGSRGIGPHIARALLARGANVTLTARSADDLERTRDRLGGDRVATAAGDVKWEDDRVRVVREAEAAFGPLDVLVNNAGVELVLPFAEMTEDEIAHVIRVNLEAPIQLTRLVLPSMIERRRGHIVNMSSLSAYAAPPYHTIYAATKAGLLAFSLSIRAEVGRSGVSASAICPGFVEGAGMYEEQRAHQTVPKASGTVTNVRAVVRAVVRAIERNVPDIIVANGLGKLADLGQAISPRLVEKLGWLGGAYGTQAREAMDRAAGRRGRRSGPASGP